MLILNFLIGLRQQSAAGLEILHLWAQTHSFSFRPWSKENIKSIPSKHESLYLAADGKVSFKCAAQISIGVIAAVPGLCADDEVGGWSSRLMAGAVPNCRITVSPAPSKSITSGQWSQLRRIDSVLRASCCRFPWTRNECLNELSLALDVFSSPVLRKFYSKTTASQVRTNFFHWLTDLEPSQLQLSFLKWLLLPVLFWLANKWVSFIHFQPNNSL